MSGAFSFISPLTLVLSNAKYTMYFSYNMSETYTSLRVTKSVHSELAKLGNLNQSYSDVISNLLKSAKKDTKN